MQVVETLDLTLEGGRNAPSMARAALRSMNGSLAGLGQPVRLLVSELVTNAVQHGGAGCGQTLKVRFECSDARVRVEVIDQGPGFAQRSGGSVDPVEEGFGLSLVDQLSDRWGVAVDHGARVWFEMDRAA